MLRKIASEIRGGLFVLLCTVCPWNGSTLAADPTELWPELGVFWNTTPRTRLFFDLAFARDADSYDQSLDVLAFADFTLKPIAKRELPDADWVRNRYLWARVGCGHFFSASDGVRSTPEERAILELRARAPLPAQIWLEGRARVDLRWMGGDFSTRYRLRIEVNREFTILDHAVTPYLQVEWFYDTRYNGWSRILYQLGPEITVGKHFRYEVYVARQVDRLPTYSPMNSAELFLKWYF